MPPTLFFLKIVLAIWDLCISIKFLELLCSSSVENAIGILIGVAIWMFIASLFIIEQNGNNQNKGLVK